MGRTEETMPALDNKLRIAVGGLTFEGNSLSPVVADYQTCERILLKQGAELVRDLAGKGTEMSGALYTLGLSEEVEVVPLITSTADAPARTPLAAWRSQAATAPPAHPTSSRCLSNGGPCP